MRRAAPLLAAVALAACGGGDDENTPAATTATSSGQGGPGVTVAVQDFAFEPRQITIAKGEQVTWRNDGAVAHTVSGKGMTDSPNSGDIAPGTTFTWRAKKVGTMRYQCTIHPQMTGEVVVTRPGAA